MELYSDKMQILWNYIPIKCRNYPENDKRDMF